MSVVTHLCPAGIMQLLLEVYLSSFHMTFEKTKTKAITSTSY